jgi:hypothetical protein
MSAWLSSSSVLEARGDSKHPAGLVKGNWSFVPETEHAAAEAGLRFRPLLLPAKEAKQVEE